MMKIFRPRNILFAIVVVVILAVLQYFGIIWHTSLFTVAYEVRGLDISHHQDDIDWSQVAEMEKYDFVFMKATEGHDFVDHRFLENWSEAREQGLHVGAYHFFSMRSSGGEQAEYFISMVPVERDSLPHVIDLEIADTYDPERVRGELTAFADALDTHYGRRPILYATYETYDAYLRGHFSEYDIWFRDIMKPPTGLDRSWTFWQYSNRGHIDGIDAYTDKNVFSGSEEEFEEYLSSDLQKDVPRDSYAEHNNDPINPDSIPEYTSTQGDALCDEIRAKSLATPSEHILLESIHWDDTRDACIAITSRPLYGASDWAIQYQEENDLLVVVEAVWYSMFTIDSSSQTEELADEVYSLSSLEEYLANPDFLQDARIDFYGL